MSEPRPRRTTSSGRILDEKTAAAIAELFAAELERDGWVRADLDSWCWWRRAGDTITWSLRTAVLEAARSTAK